MAKPHRPPNYPNNKKTLRHISVKALPDLAFGTPPSAANLQLICPSGHRFKPPWTSQLPFEYAPFQITLQNGDRASYAPAAVNVRCPVCQSQTEIRFPSPEESRGTVDLYGDESYHLSADQKRYFFAYAFVGTYADGRDLLRKRMDAFKLALRPDAPPASWQFHANQIRQPEWRVKNGVTADISRINEEMIRLGAALAEIPDQRSISVTVCPVLDINKVFKDGRKPRDGIRDLTISFAMYTLTDVLTQHGFSPVFVLESVNNSAQPQFMDIAVERVARALFCNLSYLYVSRSKVMILPSDETKGSSAEMEYADLVAFSVNRAFSRRSIGREPEVPLETLGPVCWGAFTPARVGVSIATGFPWGRFYPGF